MKPIANKFNVPTTTDEYLRGQGSCGIESGDRVKVLFKWAGYQNGWRNTWIRDMNRFVGKIGEVRGLNFDAGIEVRFREADLLGNPCYWSYNFPYFCLEKVR